MNRRSFFNHIGVAVVGMYLGLAVPRVKSLTITPPKYVEINVTSYDSIFFEWDFGDLQRPERFCICPDLEHPTFSVKCIAEKDFEKERNDRAKRLGPGSPIYTLEQDMAELRAIQ